MNASRLCNHNEFETILTNDCAAECINANLDYLLTLMPEVKSMIGFEHKHPHHHLDVWQHTLEVIRYLNTNDLELNMAALFHDIGKPFSYQEGNVRHFYGHPEVSGKIAQQILVRLGYNNNFINRVLYLVTTHDTTINPSHLDNDFEMIRKRLQLQYADAKAHHPDKVSQRIEKLDALSQLLGVQV